MATGGGHGAVVCGACGHHVPPPARFCSSCGAQVGDGSPPVPGTEGERRQLTVMFCDLVGSTALADGADPEDVRDVLRAYHRAAGEIIARHGGMVSRYQGDGLFVYFGYPTAGDDDARRAIDAGLELVDAIPHLSPDPVNVPLRVRVGIDTGMVVVGEMGWGARLEPHDIVGDTANIASRVEASARPGTVLVSSRTWRLVQGFFEGEDHGFHQLRGVDRPMQLFEIRRRTSVGDRVDLPSRRSPLVGRERVLARLAGHVEDALADGGVVTLVGDAGVGKSRLVAAVLELLANPPTTRARCTPVTADTPLHPMLECIRADLDRLDDPLVRVRAAERAGVRDEVIVADRTLLEGLLSGDAAAAGVDRRRRHDAVLRWLRAARGRVLVIEDVHWADPATSAVIADVARSPEGVAMVITSRSADAGTVDGAVTVLVEPLPDRAARALVESLAGRRTLPNPTVNRIIERAGGVPLFVEEMVRAALDAPEGASPDDAVPATLHDSLMARLDGLGPYKDTAQRCAVLGSTITPEGAEIVSDLPAADVRVHLDELQRRGVLVEAGGALAFRHALLRDTAYDSLLRRTRRELHARVAAYLDGHSEVHVPHEVRAFHYQEAGLHHEALAHWRRAARHAARISDFPEALRHTSKGLALLGTVEPGPERDRSELDLLRSRTAALGLTGQRGREELRSTLERALELAETVGDRPWSMTFMSMLATVMHAYGELSEAGVLSQQLLRSVEQPDLSWFEPFARQIAGSTLLWQGQVSAAMPYLAQAAESFAEFAAASDPVTVSGITSALTTVGLAEWLGGASDGLDRFREAVRIGLDAAAPQSVCLVLATESVLHQLAGRVEQALRTAEAATEYAADTGNAWDEWAEVVRAWATDALVPDGRGLDHLERALATSEPSRQHLRPYFLGLLADRFFAHGEDHRAMTTVEDAIALARRNREGFYEPELLRLRALGLARAGDAEEARRALDDAVALAEDRGAQPFAERARAALAALPTVGGAGSGRRRSSGRGTA